MNDKLATLAKKYHSGMMDEHELSKLGQLLLATQQDRQPTDYIIEIGSFHGHTACFLFELMQSCNEILPILCIDPFERVVPDDKNPQGVYAEFMRNVSEVGADQHCYPLVAFSHDCHSIVRDGACLLIVDGDHRYEACKQDLELYVPKVRPGGFVFIDDFAEVYEGVKRATEEYFPAHQLNDEGWFAHAQLDREMPGA